MKLLLTSSGLRNESLKSALLGMLDKPVGECNMVFIPTAANGAPSDKSWLVYDIHNAYSMEDTQNMGWKSFDILDLAVKASWDKKLWWPVVEAADVIMIGGGNAGYLSYWMQQSGLFDALPELLKTKVYVGISAGSMMATAGLRVVAGALKNTAEPYEVPLNDPYVPTGQVSRKTLGFTEFLFRPHWDKPVPKYDDLNEAAMRKAYEAVKTPIYLVDDDTGLKIVDSQTEVITEGKWLLIDGDSSSS